MGGQTHLSQKEVTFPVRCSCTDRAVQVSREFHYMIQPWKLALIQEDTRPIKRARDDLSDLFNEASHVTQALPRPFILWLCLRGPRGTPDPVSDA